MGWGKGKGKAVERALHQAEREEEWAAERALARGDIAGAIAHAQNAEALENAEHAAHWKGKGKGKWKGYRHAEAVVVPAAQPEVVVVSAKPAQPEVVVVSAVATPVRAHKGAGKGVEGALHRGEKREEALAGAALAHGDIVGAAIHAERASELKDAERAVHQANVHAREWQAHQRERREEHLAARDLAHGNVLGAIAHELKAAEAHERAHHHHHKGKGKGWW